MICATDELLAATLRYGYDARGVPVRLDTVEAVTAAFSARRDRLEQRHLSAALRSLPPEAALDALVQLAAPDEDSYRTPALPPEREVGPPSLLDEHAMVCAKCGDAVDAGRAGDLCGVGIDLHNRTRWRPSHLGAVIPLLGWHFDSSTLGLALALVFVGWVVLAAAGVLPAAGVQRVLRGGR